jgi:hypothetical protein
MRTLLTTLFLSTMLLAGGDGNAAQRTAGVFEEATPPAFEALQQCNGITLSQAVEQVRRQYNGRIVSAETQVSGSCETHVIKVLTQDGKVKTVRVAGKRRG